MTNHTDGVSYCDAAETERQQPATKASGSTASRRKARALKKMDERQARENLVNSRYVNSKISKCMFVYVCICSNTFLYIFTVGCVNDRAANAVSIYELQNFFWP